MIKSKKLRHKASQYSKASSQITTFYRTQPLIRAPGHWSQYTDMSTLKKISDKLAPVALEQLICRCPIEY